MTDLTSVPHTITDLQWFFIIFFGTVIIYFLKKRDKVFDEHEKALRENTLALVKLTVQIEFLTKASARVEVLEHDVNQLGEKVRNMSQ